MNCAECIVNKYCLKDSVPSIRRQSRFTNKIRFVMSRPESFFVDPEIMESDTFLIFQKFMKEPFDLVFCKNCVESVNLANKREERDALTNCADTLAQDLQGAQVIVMCGNEAIEAMGYDRTGGGSAGWVEYNEKLVASMLATYDPHQVEEYPENMFKDFIWTIQHAQRIVRGEVPDRNILPVQPYHDVKSFEEFLNLVKDYPENGLAALDLETSGYTDPMAKKDAKTAQSKFYDPRVEIVQFGLYNPVEHPLVIPSSVFKDPRFLTFWNEKFVINKKLIGWNFKFDGKFLRHKLGLNMPIAFDNQLTHQKIDERTGIHDMGRCSRVYLNYKEYWLELGKYLKMEGGYLNAPWDDLAQYLAHDLRITYDAHVLFWDKLGDARGSKVYPWKIFLSQRQQLTQVIRPVVNELLETELVGNTIDRPELEALIAEAEPIVEATRKELEGVFFDMTGKEYSASSNKQLLKFLKEVNIFGPYDDSVKKKFLDAKIEDLRTSKEDIALLKSILAYKQMAKMLSAFYIGSRDRAVKDENGEWHLFPTFNVAGTVGSRWSSTNPNLQQLPRKDKGPFKQIFIPRVQGRIIFQNDFSSLEARVAAYLSGDKVLADACQRDLHQIVAEKSFAAFFERLTTVRDMKDMEEFTGGSSLLLSCYKTISSGDLKPKKGEVETDPFKLAVKLVREHLRSCAKTITYGIFFGRGPRALAMQELNCEVEQAEHFIDEYYKLFPGLYKWILTVQEIVRTEGIIVTPCGCVRDLRAWKFSPSLSSRNRARGRAQRQAVNFLTQVFGGTLQNLAYARAGKYLRAQGIGELRAGVHDSTVGEVDFNVDTKYHLQEIRNLQETVFPEPEWLCKIDTELGFNWGKLQKEEDFFKENELP